MIRTWFKMTLRTRSTHSLILLSNLWNETKFKRINEKTNNKKLVFHTLRQCSAVELYQCRVLSISQPTPRVPSMCEVPAI